MLCYAAPSDAFYAAACLPVRLLLSLLKLRYVTAAAVPPKSCDVLASSWNWSLTRSCWSKHYGRKHTLLLVLNKHSLSAKLKSWSDHFANKSSIISPLFFVFLCAFLFSSSLFSTFSSAHLHWCLERLCVFLCGLFSVVWCFSVRCVVTFVIELIVHIRSWHFDGCSFLRNRGSTLGSAFAWTVGGTGLT